MYYCPPVQDGGEDEEDGDGAEGIELGEEGGRLEVDEREEEEDEEEGHRRELAPHQLHRAWLHCTLAYICQCWLKVENKSVRVSIQIYIGYGYSMLFTCVVGEQFGVEKIGGLSGVLGAVHA